jgi:hypothetical protein
LGAKDAGKKVAYVAPLQTYVCKKAKNLMLKIPLGANSKRLEARSSPLGNQMNITLGIFMKVTSGA